MTYKHLQLPKRVKINSLDRLIEADYIDSTDEVFTYDDPGNRLTLNTRGDQDVAYLHNVANEYTSIGGQSVGAAGWAYGPRASKPPLARGGYLVSKVFYQPETRNLKPETYYYYAHNHLYSPVALMEDDGDVVERYEYDVYGKPYFYNSTLTALLDPQKSTKNNPVMFTGQRFDRLDDGDLQLMYYKNRFYCPTTGRFLQRDPIRYKDGMNLYQYVESSPINYYDPYGYCKDKCQFRSIDFIDIKMQITRYNTEDDLLLKDDDQPTFTGDETKDKLIRKIIEEILTKKKYRAAYDWALEKVADAVVATSKGYHVRLKAKYKCCIKKKTCIKHTFHKGVWNLLGGLVTAPFDPGWKIEGRCFYYDWDDENYTRHLFLAKGHRFGDDSQKNKVSYYTADFERYAWGGLFRDRQTPTEQELASAIENLKDNARRDCRHRGRYGTALPLQPHERLPGKPRRNK